MPGNAPQVCQRVAGGWRLVGPLHTAVPRHPLPTPILKQRHPAMEARPSHYYYSHYIRVLALALALAALVELFTFARRRATE